MNYERKISTSLTMFLNGAEVVSCLIIIIIIISQSPRTFFRKLTWQNIVSNSNYSIVFDATQKTWGEKGAVHIRFG